MFVQLERSVGIRAKRSQKWNVETSRTDRQEWAISGWAEKLTPKGSMYLHPFYHNLFIVQ